MPQISPCTEKRSASSSTDTTAAPGKPCRILRTAADIAEEDPVRVLLHTAYSEYSRENLHMSDALDFIAEFTQHIPPKGLQLIRRYGLYVPRTKGRWEDCLGRPVGRRMGGETPIQTPSLPRARAGRRFQRMMPKLMYWPINGPGPDFWQGYTKSIRWFPRSAALR